MKNEKYYLGLDIGTDSVGYAATNKSYDLLKFHGEPAWGVTLFDEAQLKAERRSFRTARRRLDRRQERVILVRELFASEIAKTDPEFFKRLQASNLFRDEVGFDFTIYNDDGFTDKEYYERYPTIHHLIYDLMTSAEKHDARLVYLACAWLVAHRGHFLSNVDKNNIAELRDFSSTYENFCNYFIANEYAMPWNEITPSDLGVILCKKQNITNKKKALIELLYSGTKPSKTADESFPFNREAIISLLAGGSVKVKDIFLNDEYEEAGSVSLGMAEENFVALQGSIGEDYDLIEVLRAMYDWAVLADVIGKYDCISASKIAIYDQHAEDLALLKKIIRKYTNKYNEVFRDNDNKKDNYVKYTHHTDEPHTEKWGSTDAEGFSKYILSIIKNITPDAMDEKAFADMKTRLELHTFMPKQKTTDNRVIPHQLYWYEMNCLLEKASGYLPFLSEKDSDGLSVKDKLLSVFLFRVPYFVGPLNEHSSKAWIVRKAGKIYPWNFDKMVDLDASEEEFIKKLTNYCTYLPGERVLPKDSLCYQKFTVLNEINNLRINGQRISVELKQQIFNELFKTTKKVTRKKLTDWLKKNNILSDNDEITGIDTEIKSAMPSFVAFKSLLERKVLTETQIEKIIERAAYAEDKSRLAIWLAKEFSFVSEDDRKHICRTKIHDFGRLSRRFLDGIEGIYEPTGELMTINSALWNTQFNLMEIINSEEFSFKSEIEKFRTEYYSENRVGLTEKLDEMYVSNAVKRPIFRTLDIVKDVVKAFGVPEKIFVEMARGATEEQKNKRTKTRKEQILELYDKIKSDDIPALREKIEKMGDYADNRLQSEKLFLYYLQLGKCMYSGEPIDLDNLLSDSSRYNVDHIFPRAFVKDDSIINNKVLVLSTINGEKTDAYPIAADIRNKMSGHWSYLKDHNLISEEKYKRLTRATAFSEEEKYNFINRQIVETTQSTKAVTVLLKELYPETEIVFVKAKLTSEFRQEFDLIKSRSFNDLHHAVDAYLNIVTGNVYNMKFTKRWFNVNSNYSIKTSTLFSNPQKCGNELVWDGQPMLSKVKDTAVKNTAHFTKYSYIKKGGFFDQMPLPKSEGLVPLKKNLPTEKYGGFNKPAISFFIPVKYKAGKKTEIIIMSVEVLHGEKFLYDAKFAEEYSLSRLGKILNKRIDEVSFPLGLRPWKVNTMLSLDGFLVCIAGSGSGGKCLVAQPVMQFSDKPYWNFYLKKLEEVKKKLDSNSAYCISEKYDKVSKEDNIKLYDIYISKFTDSIFRKRINNPVETLKKGRGIFEELSITDQIKALLNIHQTFGRISGGCDLTLIGGVGKAAATVSFSSTISNWAKLYSDVRIVDRSTSGLWETRSVNILELI